MSKSSEPPLSSNSLGGCLEAHEVHPAERNHHILRLRAPQGVVDQVRIVSPSYRTIRGSTQPWTHALWSPEPDLAESTRRLMELLGRVLTLPAPANTDFAIALDRYKVPVDGVDPTTWDNTDIGDMVSRGKYLYKKASSEAKLRAVGTALVRRLDDVIEEHPILRAIDTVVAVPGHDRLVVSFGSRLSRAVAKKRGLKFVQCKSIPEFRTPAKDLASAHRARMIAGRFFCTATLSGPSALIVDDVFRSGVTIAETARAVRAAGCSRVAALCPVRTVRG